MLLLILSIYIYQTLTSPPPQSYFLFFLQLSLSAQMISLFLSDPVSTHKVWNTKSLKEMPFFVKIHQHYPQGRNSLDNTQQGEHKSRARLGRVMLNHSGIQLICFPFWNPWHTEMMTKHSRQASLSLSLSLLRLTPSHWPRSEHWTTLKWQWHPKGHMGMSGGRISSTAEPSSSSLIIAIIPPLSILSMAKSQKPFCSKGRAEEGESSRTMHSHRRREQCGNIFNLRKHKKAAASVCSLLGRTS